MSAIADKLDEARALIERGWTQGVSARNSSGRPVGIKSPEATNFCMIGALFRVDGYVLCYSALHDVVGGMLGRFNDGHSHAEVVEAFRKAAELARVQA